MADPTNNDGHTATDPANDRIPGPERASRLRAGAVGAGLGIIAVIGIGAGTGALAGAQTDPPAVGADDASPAPGERLAEALAPLVEDGTLTQEQADAVVARLLEAGAQALEDWQGRMGGRHGEGFGGRGFPAVSAVTDLLGLSPDDLRDALREGATLAELASDAGVTTDELRSAMLSGVEEHLAARVADGDMTQEEADEHLARATKMADAVIDGELPARPGHDRAPRTAEEDGTTEDPSA